MHPTGDLTLASPSGDSITRFPILLCRITLALSIATFVWIAWNAYAGYRDAELFRNRESRLAELRGTIVHLDEVLTMSARMAAATGDRTWEERYRRYEPELDAAIKKMMTLEPGGAAIAASAQTDAANVKLVEMETEAFALVREGRSNDARAVLFSPDYEEQKTLYAQGMEQLLVKVRARLDEGSRQATRRAILSTGGSVVLLGLSMVSWIVVIGTLRRTHAELEQRVEERTTALTDANRTLLTEVSERRHVQAELVEARDQALEATRLKAEFLANMSHEIRTPLNGVIGMTGLLLDTPLTRMQRDFAETIRSSGDALMSVINDVLDFSKVEASKLSLEMLDFDLSDVIEGSVELVAERAFNKGIELIAFIDPALTSRFRGDAGRIRQVITNLVANAVKFTEHGDVVVRALPLRFDETETLVRIEVKDSGIGIAPDIQARLFQAFTQADGSTTRKFGGTGLGLAISKALVTLMKGEIGVDSEAGKGATFWVTLPLGKPEQDAAEAADVERLAGVRLLIVDDHTTNRQILLHQTRAWKVTNNEAASGPAALEMLRQAAMNGAPYGIAILDMEMPGMDGLMLARAIKADPAIAGTRLIVLTSLGQRLDDETMRTAGIEDCLIKPVKKSRLFELLAAVIGKSTGDSSPARPVHTPEVPVKKLRVLIAEDNIVNQRVALGQLRKLGYHADVVANGREVLDVLRRIPYDVIFMDCQMPELDGFQATGQIREREQAFPPTAPARAIHIIAMTANALRGDRERCLNAGMDDYVAKPTRMEDLQAALDRRQTAVSTCDPMSDTLATVSSGDERQQPVGRQLD
jgi:signal transduction histidine kinase/CheY-like chemotaxis protein